MAGVTVLEPEIQMLSIDPQMLNEKQYCAYQIIVNHLSETLAGQSPPPLRMILYGECYGFCGSLILYALRIT